MKRIMILGGNPETAVLVNTANAMGFYTIVVDMDHGSPAKKNAAESYDVDVFDIDKMVALAQKLNVEAVLIGVVDVLVKPYKEICERLNMPCYVTEKAVEAFCSKDGFKKYCLEYNIRDIPGIYLDESSEIGKPEGIDYPLMIKPVDRGGGVGMKICRNDAEYEDSVKTALKFSKKGVVLVEKYMECDDMAAYYTFRNGVPYISAISDRFTTNKQGDASPVCIGAVYPSKYSELFIRDVHPKLCELFKGLNIQNGVLNIQFFVEDNIFYAYDPGFRLQGEGMHYHLAHVNGFDQKEMFVNYAFTGIFGDDDFSEKNDYNFKGKSACTVWVLLKDGQIDSIQRLDEIKADDNVVFVLERFKGGDVIPESWLGTEKQVYLRIYLVTNSITETNAKIEKIKNLLKVYDSDGKDMILEWLKPFNEEEYK